MKKRKRNVSENDVLQVCWFIVPFLTILICLFVDDDAKQEFKYVHELCQEEKLKLQNRPIVGIDPNKRDLIYCVSVQGRNSNQRFKSFRYTYPQVS